MARIRTIKPDYFTSFTIEEIDDPWARLTFIGLWTHCDDEGRCADDARLIKGAIWPLNPRTADDVEADLKTIEALGLITRYTVSGRHYLEVNGWEEHQRINRPTPSKIPPKTVSELQE